MKEIFTIGHSTRPIEEFLELLKKHGVEQLVDIRSVPGSRRNPQYGQKALRESLLKHGIDYVYMKSLGGFRPEAENSINMGWRNESFRNYADYMQTEEFAEGIEELIHLAQKPTVIMCAEAVPWRCHRSLVADALIVRGIRVRDIIDSTHVSDHTMTKFAKVDGYTITYPEESEDE